MKNRDLERLNNGFAAVGGLRGVKFSYGVAKNTRVVSAIIADLDKTIKPDDGFRAFDKAREELCQEHAKKDENTGRPQTSAGSYVFEDMDAFETAFAELKESDDHKEAFERHEANRKEHQTLLDEESDYKPYMIPYSCVPADITARQLEAIYDIIAEPEPVCAVLD